MSPTIKKSSNLFKAVLALNSQADGENSSPTWPLKPPKLSSEKEQKTSLTLKSKDTQKLKKFQEELWIKVKFLMEWWSTRILLILRCAELLKIPESFFSIALWSTRKEKVRPTWNLKMRTLCVKLLTNKCKKLPLCATISLSGSLISWSQKKESLIWLNISYWKETFHALEELEKLTMSELQEYLEPESSTDQKKFNNRTLEHSVDFSTSERLEMTISHTLSSVKLLLLALSSLEEHQKTFSMRWKEISMIA